MARPRTDRDRTMVEKQIGKKSKDKISSFTKTPKLDESELLENKMKPKSSMKRKLTFTLSPERNEEQVSDTDSDPGHLSETWGERFNPPCWIYTEKDSPEKKKMKKEAGSKKSTPVNILFGYPLSERKQMALLMQMTAKNKSPDSTPSHPSQAVPVQKKISSSTVSKQKDKVNKRNERGETALHMAAIRGDAKQVKELIGLGADVNVKDFAGWTPLHEACNLGHYDVAKVLIAAGAEVNTQGLDNDTPLHDASSSGHGDIVRLLLQHGGNAFQANNRGERPVDVADSKVIEQLLKGEMQLSDSEHSSSEFAEPSSADENMEYSGTERDPVSKKTNAENASASKSKLDEYEFKDEEAEKDSNKAFKHRHLLRVELRQRAKEKMESNKIVAKQEKSKPLRTCKSKKEKISSLLCHSSETSSNETSPERKNSATSSLIIEHHRVRAKEELNLAVGKKEEGNITIMNKNPGKGYGDSPSQVQSVKHNQHVEPDNSMSSCSKAFKCKDKSKHHHKDLSLDSEPENVDSGEGALQRTDKEGKVIKKHKCINQEKDKNRKENNAEKDKNQKKNETDMEKLIQREAHKYGNKDLEFDREFWKENFFKSNENEELLPTATDIPESGSIQKATDVPQMKEDRLAKEKHSYSKDRKQKGEWEKDKDSKKDEEEIQCKEENKNVNIEENADCHVFNHGPEYSFHKTGMKEEQEDKPTSENDHEIKLQDQPEKQAQEGSENKLPGKERESEKADRKHSERERKPKTEHVGDKYDLSNCTNKWKEKEKLMCGSSCSPIDKNQKETDKPKPIMFSKKVEDDKKSKEKLDRKNEKEKHDKDCCLKEIRDKEKNSIDKKGKTSERVAIADQGNPDIEKDHEKKKKDKRKDVASSNSSTKSFHEEKRSSVTDGRKLPYDRLKQKEDILKPLEKDKRDKDRDVDRHRDRHKDKLQQTKTNKIKMNDAEADGSKLKSSPAPKDARPKEKRLVNDDLMQTSFERMLSLKDQEIEQWHRKQKEKIKQKERERMKQQPGTEHSKLKNKDKMKNLSGLGKELLRSKCSEVSEAYSTEKELKEATSPRSISLDTRSPPHTGRAGLCLENSMSHSPIAESDKSSLMSRSVSMISFASSEESCQLKALTQGPLTEYASDFMQDGLDSHLSTSQSSFAVHSLKSPVVHEKKSDGFLDGVPGENTALHSKQEPPNSRSAPDEDGKSVSSNSSYFHEHNWSGTLPDREHSKGSLLESLLPPSENHRSQELLLPSFSNYSSETTAVTGNAIIHLNPPVPLDANPAFGTGSRKTLLKDLDQTSCRHVNLSQASTTPQTATEMKRHIVTEPPFERDVQHPRGDSTMETSTVKSDPECVIKKTTESTMDTSGICSISCSPQGFTNRAASDCYGEHQHDHMDLCVDLLQRAQRNSEKKENTSLLEDTPCCGDRKLEDWTKENHSSDLSGTARGKCKSSTGLLTTHSSTKRDMTGKNTENFTLNVSVSGAKTDETQEAMETDSVILEDTNQAVMKESIWASDHQSGQNEFVSPAAVECCPGAKCQPQVKTAEATQTKEKNGIVEIGDNTCLLAEAGPQEHKMSPEIGEDSTDFPAVPEAKVQQIQDTSDSSNSGLQGTFPMQQSPVSSPKPGNGDSDSSDAKTKIRPSEEDEIQLHHPRKRKLHQMLQPIHTGYTIPLFQEKPQQSLAAIVDSLKLEDIEPYQTERANPYYEFLHIRRKIEEKRKVLCSVIPQAPQYYDEYVTFNGSYLLDGNPLSKICIPTITPPPSLPEQLKEMFKQQEVVRTKLRLQHSIEREKLILSNEQEVLRVHYRAARTLANQALPFSACTVLLDAEVYNMPQDVQGDDGKTSVRDRFNARQFISWLQDVDDKFDKLKTCLLMRQQHEAVALNAVQRLEWQLKLQELDPATHKATSIFHIPEFYIPLVEVNDDFELTPI
ncbi:hypothetical protein JZ751_003827 [Albula glossodonta]|uniref:Ankyrin repeat domain-containing protein 12 n=1 Tax=Albula glossodonta TaxID=121402 RepID=A0A8T2PDU2_9TELE|nr:hypothetical protein JZ751_003827 [Albula glossodonta]